jgi:phosphoenolpyruvate synthase/pyruvate phosphate dikinase
MNLINQKIYVDFNEALKINDLIEKKFDKISRGNDKINLSKLEKKIRSLQIFSSRESLDFALDSNRKILAKIEQKMGENTKLIDLHSLAQHFNHLLRRNLLDQHLLNDHSESNEETQTISKFNDFLKSDPDSDELILYLSHCEDKERLSIFLFLLTPNNSQTIDRKSLKALLNSPELSVKYFNDDKAMRACLKSVIFFISNYQHQLQNPLLVNYLNGYLADLIAFLNLFSNNQPFSLEFLFPLLQLLQNQNLEPSLHRKLKALHDLAFPLSLQTDSIDLDREEISYKTRHLDRGLPGETPENLLAIDVSNIIEGSDMKGGGIRKRIHTKPGPEVLLLLNKDIEEFQSGRRTFVFLPVNSVDISNYQTVMLYLIRALKEDKAKYYKKHPNYINQLEYEKAKKILENGLISLDSIELDQRYVFEFVSEELIAMEKSLVGACEEQEIIPLLDKFRNLYDNIPNYNVNLTVCTCISSSGLFLSNPRKPVITFHPPDELLKLREMQIGKRGNEKTLRWLFANLTENTKALPEGAITFKSALSIFIQQIKNNDYEYRAKKGDFWGMASFKKTHLTETQQKEQREETYSFLQIMLEADSCLKQLKSFQELKKFLQFLGITRQENVLVCQQIRKLASNLEQGVEKSALKEKDKEKVKETVVYFKEEFLPKQEKILQASKGREIVNELELLYLECEQRLHDLKGLITLPNDFWIHQKIETRQIDQRKLKSLVTNFEREMARELNLPPRKLRELEGKLSAALDQKEYYSEKDPMAPVQTSQFVQLEEAVRAILETKAYLSKKFCHTQQNNLPLFRDAHTLVRYLESIENSLSELLVDLVEKSKGKEEKLEALNLLIEMIREQGLISLDLLENYPQTSRDLQPLQNVLTERRNQSLNGYEALRFKFINSPFVQECLKKQDKTLDNACQFIKGNTKEPLLFSLDRAIQLIAQDIDQEKVSEDKILLAGHANEERSVLGKARVVRDISQFDRAEKGEILIIDTMPPDIYKYREAAAIISEEGGIYNHTAIDLKDLNIPFICGVKEGLKLTENLNGSMIHLSLSKKKDECFLQVMKEDVLDVMVKLARISKDHPEAFLEFFVNLNSLPVSSEIKKLILNQALDKIFQFDFNSILKICQAILSNNEISFIHACMHQKINKDSKKVIQMLKRFQRSDNIQEKRFLLSQMKKERDIASIFGISLDINILNYEEFIKKDDRLEKLNRDGVGGKAEGLSLAQTCISQKNLPFKSISLDVPEFFILNQHSLVESYYEQLIDGQSLKAHILSILKNQDLKIGERRCEIEKLFAKAQILPIHLKGLEEIYHQVKNNASSLIVRSSCAVEDRKSVSAAGLFDSIKGVDDISKLPVAIIDVLKSAFSLRSLEFWSTFPEFDPESLFQMDVIIQQEIQQAIFSGVGFSVAQDDNWDYAAFQMDVGLGSGVEGKTTPNLAIVDTKHQIITSLDIHQKNLFLSPEIIKEIANLLKWLEEKFGYPVDVEFICTKDAPNKLAISIVQVRPITQMQS